MVYSDEEFEDIFLKENKDTAHIPTYIREYNKFFRLCKLFSNYIRVAVSYIERILSQLNLSKAHGAILEKIAERLDISIEKPADANGNYDQAIYEEMLKIAILGNGIKRNSRADRNSMNEIVKIFDSIRKVEITDYGKNDNNDLAMILNMRVIGNNDIWSPELLEKHVLPNITGVRMAVTYLLDNNIYFGFDMQELIVNVIESGFKNNPTQDDLNNYVYENNIRKSPGITIIDLSNNYWVFEGESLGWVNESIKIPDIKNGDRIDAAKHSKSETTDNYMIRGWDEGSWAKSKIIK